MSLESVKEIAMQYDLNNPTFFLSLLCCLFSVIFMFNLLTTRRRSKLNVPPSPPKLPLIGNLHQVGTLPHRTFRDLSRRYGPFMLLHLGQTPTLVVSSADIFQEIVKSHDVIFSNRPQSTAANIFYGHKGMGVAPYGEDWRKKRKICTVQLLNLKKVQSLQFIREEEVEQMVTKIREACGKNIGCSMNITEMLIEASNNIVSRCLLDLKCDTPHGSNSFGHTAKEVLKQYVPFSFGDFFPSLAWMDVVTGLMPKLRATFREVDDFFDEVIAQHKIAKRNDHGQSNGKDFVDILFQFQEDYMLDNKLTQDEIKAIILDIFVGGTDTTATTMEWIMAELIKNPITMKKAEEEVQKVVGNKSKIDENDVKQMKYLECVIKEVLRLHPPGPFSPRKTSSSVRLRGYDIPAKANVFINLWAIQRDPQVWERAEEFVPERFENSEIDFKGQYFQFMLFGSGRRICLGMSFGDALVSYVIANLLYWFDWKLPEFAKDIDMSEIYEFTATKKLPLYLHPMPQFGFKV